MASAAVIDPVDNVSDYSDNDSLCSFESSNASGTTSLASDVQDYVYEHGRRYHGYKDGKCPMPNDEVEQDRLDMLNALWSSILDGRIYLAPVQNPKNVLDCGTGTGIWAIEAADVFPSATIYGNDLSPIQPRWVPPNVRFEVDDVEDEWAWGTKKFDFIHSRDMIGSIADWPKYLENIYTHLNEGGYIELQEFDFTKILTDADSLPATAQTTYRDNLFKASEKYGKPFDLITKYARMLREAGFTNIVQRKFQVPVGTWPRNSQQKRMGALCHAVLSAGAEAYALKMCTSALGMELEAVNKVIQDYIAEISNKAVHSSYEVHVIYARKPEAPTPTIGLDRKRKKEDSPVPEAVPELETIGEEDKEEEESAPVGIEKKDSESSAGPQLEGISAKPEHWHKRQMIGTTPVRRIQGERDVREGSAEPSVDRKMRASSANPPAK